MVTIPVQIPDHIINAIEDGEITQTQLRELIGIEAAMLGMSFDEAVAGARDDTLPHDPIGSDLRMLVMMLMDNEVDASV